MLDTTVLSETEQRTGIPGLKGMADNMAIVANATDETYTSWDAFVTAAQALTGGKQAWLCIKTPKLTNCTYMQGMPSPKGSSAYEVNSILKTNLYFAPSGAPVFAAAPTAVQSGTNP